jgi:[ribosomal protein S18]-alanine N-acetyltransferase
MRREEAIMEPVLPADLRIERVGASSTKALGGLFCALASDVSTVRFFHPHPLTADHAAELSARASASRDFYYLWTYRRQAVGYSMLRGWEEGFAIPSFGAAVHPAVRGAGLGGLLLAHAIGRAQHEGANYLRLTVSSENTPAIHLYRKFGFALRQEDDLKLLGMLGLAPPPIFARSTLKVVNLAALVA